MNTYDYLDGTEIAVIGMVGRFPGARNLDEFWHNLCDGVEAIRFPDDGETTLLLFREGIPNRPTLRAPIDLDESP